MALRNPFASKGKKEDYADGDLAAGEFGLNGGQEVTFCRRIINYENFLNSHLETFT